MAEINYIEFTPSPLLTQRMHAKLAREALRRAAHYHLHTRLGKHYKDIPETAPGGAYGYRRRTKKYLDRKRKKRGHQLPNVYTGSERNFVRNTGRITATQNRSRLYLRRKHIRRQELSDEHARELAAFSPEERREIVAQAHEFYLDAANHPDNQRQRAPKRRL